MRASSESILDKDIVMKAIPDYGDVMTLQEFLEQGRDGLIAGNDGTGYFAVPPMMSDVYAVPSRHVEFVPEWATHVVWFNK